eukprot:3149405-Amphidinium_carterae.1
MVWDCAAFLSQAQVDLQDTPRILVRALRLQAFAACKAHACDSINATFNRGIPGFLGMTARCSSERRARSQCMMRRDISWTMAQYSFVTICHKMK